MELDLNSQEEESRIKKLDFCLRTDRTDGLILQVHHSYPDSGGSDKKFNFIYASFNDPGTHLAVADHKGHIFVINLEKEKYWQLPNVGLPTVISFPVSKTHELLTGLDTSSIILVHVETGNILGVLNGHAFPVNDVSYSDTGYYYLTSNNSEAIIWDSCSFSQIHRLALKSDVALKKIMFMPVTSQILACFQDDTMHVWKFGSFECIKQIIPETWKTHHLKAIALTKNGRALVIAGYSPSLVIFNLDTWVVSKVVDFPNFISGIKQMEFVSQVFDGGANKILAMLNTSLELYFFDIETSTFLKGMQQIFGMTVKFVLNNTGKYISCILTTGEVNIYLNEKILSNRKQIVDLEKNFTVPGKNSSNIIISRNNSNSSKRTQRSCESLNSIKKELKEILNLKKLLPILKQFGEFPESYRVLIWKNILQLPGSQEAFISLSSKACHPSFTKLESKYPLVNKSLCNSLKKLLSNLSHWCPLFGEVEFLPEFVFPFVKQFHSDPLACFEAVATIIVNWCQNWFEFYPFPPINMLSAMENILGHHDPDLLEFYLKNNITSSISFCPLLHTVFSEVLAKDEWLKFWDHVLSNEPSFLFMSIIAYNIVCKNVIKNLSNTEEVEKFFHKQNVVDLKKLITKTYQLLKETPDDIHSRQYFAPFRPLSSGEIYITFTAYPKLIVDPSTEKLQIIRKEEDKLLEEQLKALSIKSQLEKKLQQNNKSELQEKIYRDLDEKIRNLVEEEENRVLAERQKLRNLRHELRLKELEVLEDTRKKALKERIKRKEIEFGRLLKDISKRKAREEMEVDVMEEEIRKYYAELLLRKSQLKLELGYEEEQNENVYASLEKQRKLFQNDLLSLEDEWGNIHHSKGIEISNKMAAIKALIHDLEIDIEKKKTEKDSQKQSHENRIFINDLKKKVKNLEDEIELLLLDNLNQLQLEKEKKKTVILHSPGQNFLRSKDKIKCDRKIKPENSPTRKSIKTVRTITKTDIPGIRKITTIRTRIPKNKSKNQDIPTVKLYKTKTSDKILKPIKSTKFKPSRHLKSKFTCHVDYTEPRNKFPVCRENSPELSDSENLESMHFHQQPQGDFLSTENLSSKRKGSLSEFFINKDSSTENSEGEEEIIKAAFKERKKIIDKAKIRQMIEGKHMKTCGEKNFESEDDIVPAKKIYTGYTEQ